MQLSKAPKVAIMNSHRTETIVNQDGTLTLRDLPFEPGAAVEVVVREQASRPNDKDCYPLRGKLLRYDNPTDPVAEEDWNALR